MNNAKDVENKKRQHPEDEANFFSNLFFCWTYPVFYRGMKKEMTEVDLFAPKKCHESTTLGDEFEKAWNNEVMKSKNPSLTKAIVKVFGFDVLIQGLLIFLVEFGLKLLQPICLGRLITYFDPKQTSVSKDQAFVYAFVITFSNFFYSLLWHLIMLRNMQLGMRVKVACCSLIYRKALKLSQGALANSTIGKMVNMLSNDVRRFDALFIHFHTFWSGPIQVTVIACLLYFTVDPIALSGISLLIAFLVLQMYLGKLTAKYRSRIALKTDNRVRLMNEIVNGIQVIKMYTWEKPFAKLVELARKLEIQQLQYAYNLRAVHSSFSVFVNRAAIFICIISYVLSGHQLDAHYVFVATSFYTILRQSLTKHLPRANAIVAETLVSIRRIQGFLVQEEISDKRFEITADKESVGVEINEGTAKWSENHTDNTLTGIDFKVSAGELIGVVGPVGSGKSSLLQAILKELPLTEGTIQVNGRVSYASQEPWLFGGSIKQNILFGQPWDERKYEEVVRVCALERDFSLFPYGDNTIVGERGVLLSGGQKARVNLARAVYKDADIYLLDDPLSAVDTHVGKQLVDNCILHYLSKKCVILVTHQLQYLSSVNKMYILLNGRVEVSGSFEEVKNSGDEFIKILEKQEDEDGDESQTDLEEDVKEEVISNGINKDKKKEGPKEVKEHQTHGDVSNKVYDDYFKAGGKWFFYVIFFMFGAMQVCASFADYFISFWVNLEQRSLTQSISNITENATSTIEQFFTTENCIFIYSLLIALVMSLVLLASYLFMKACMNASKNLHNKMFNNIVYTSMSFFNLNPSGRILNRFSKDMGSIDENLPEIMLDTMQNGLQVAATSIVVITVNKWILIPTLAIIIIFYSLRIVFLASSRSVKRLEGITRSPIFSHLAASLNGLTTIRAFGAEEVLKKEFDAHQNLNSSAFYLFIAINRAFGFILDLHCTVYIGIVTFSFLFMDKQTYGGTVGLAITQATVLIGMCQYGMRQWSDLVNQMTSVERVLEYTELQNEEQNYKSPPENWPINGNINFKGLSMRYLSTDPCVLKNLNFSINSGEKIGVVGRTGAGKSSLISAIFRLAPIEGLIQIDDVDTTAISLESLRSKISIIPQEPILFSGTLRRNLDPFDKYKDPELWSALEEVELKAMVSELGAGLDTNLSEGGSNFSVGQRQLVCLARAILRDNKILVLDEATANVDPQTDALIQATIRRKFKDCTVITIAHRLHTIMDSDKILVMDAGEAVEFDHPHNLLQQSDGVFYSLVQQTGRGIAEHLHQMAEENFNKKKTD